MFHKEFCKFVKCHATIFIFLPFRNGIFGYSKVALPPISFETVDKLGLRVAIEFKPVAMELKAGEAYFINPGSVGQPRDRDPRAACAIYDTEGYVEFYRTKYDVESAMRKIMDAGLPEILARRLMIGR